MAINEFELASLVRDGFEAMHTYMGKISGETEGRLKALEERVQELTIRVAPVLKVFENDFTTRVKLLENWQETDGKKLQEEIYAFKGKLIAVMSTAIIALIGTLGTVIWFIITRQTE